MTRVYYIREHLKPDSTFMVATDASPWGMAALMYIDGILRAALYTPITTLDVERFGHAIGSDTGQQVWELLTVLVALRHWAGSWELRRFRISVRSDNVATLVAVGNLKSLGLGGNLIARELALDYGRALYRPTAVIHTPGLANHAPDWLSRRDEPGRTDPMPAVLKDISVETPAARDDSFYLAAPLPSGSKRRKSALVKQMRKRHALHSHYRARLAVIRGQR